MTKGALLPGLAAGGWMTPAARSRTPDIQVFEGGKDWIDTMLTGHLTDDVGFWVGVPPI